ncbi:c-type cytochrome biogenesis protein CcmI [Glaciecola sp. MH2013]|uniref:c-type cytochrome biogenesis protein CcmI n=1 Tax=Glaciecola sp. MH2013 TaxID=2785524 RepID=UPI00189E9192|nr:c-type cytochrome biogenesis protein CcmI [Glaciecola sp. MH2013]MBF7072211.1 c-type cytochrome biogenesis protein CcmI [Glaciecola sp. MH2013]
MVSFYLYSIFFALVAIAFVAYPWFKDRSAKKRFEVSNANVIKQRIEEIQREAQEGLIDEDEMDTAINEMKVALAEEAEFQQAQQDEAERVSLSARSAKIPLLIGAIPALAIGVWTYYDANQLSGLRDLVDATSNVEQMSQRILGQDASEVSREEYNKYALVIRQQLRKKPDDVTGWQWLARLRMTLGQSEEASQAFDRILDINPNDNQTRMQYAQALMMMGSEENLQDAKRQVLYLVSKSPQDRNYRLLLTVIAAQLGDKETAFDNFALIKAQLSANSQLYVSLVEQLKKMGASDELLALNSQDSNEDQNGNTTQTTANAEGPAFDVSVNISNELKEKLPPSGYLIVFAQDANSGARMPLAVKKIALPSFPITLNLSTSDAMITNFSLKNAKQVTITARISMDEDVMTAPGELQGRVENLDVANTTSAVNLTITEEVQ